MKFYQKTMLALISSTLVIDNSNAFSLLTSVLPQQRSVTATTAARSSTSSSTVSKSSSQEIQERTTTLGILPTTAATIATALTLVLSTNPATAITTDDKFLSSEYSSFPQTVLAASRDIGDPFALPSYSESIKNKNIDLDLEAVNKKIMEEAAKKRDDTDVDKENNQRFIDLRKEEEEEEKRLQRMKDYARKEREEAIKREKAEIAANRWNTF